MVVLDGYEEGPSTKTVHQRRSGVSGPSVNFDSDMVLKLKKDVFLSNTANKQRLMKLLGEKLQLSRCNIIHAPGDADLMDDTPNGRSVRQVNHNSPSEDLFFIRQPKQRSIT